MRLALLVLVSLLVVACSRSRELTGDASHLMPDQLAWLERTVEADFAEAPVPRGARVLAGRMIVRADGQVIATRPLMQAAMRGVSSTGGHVVDEDATEAAFLVKGEINVQAAQQDRSSVNRYLCEFQMIDVATKIVVYQQHYVITNTFEQQRWN